jgi:hypothetical protein
MLADSIDSTSIEGFRAAQLYEVGSFQRSKGRHIAVGFFLLDKKKPAGSRQAFSS